MYVPQAEQRQSKFNELYYFYFILIITEDNSESLFILLFSAAH